MRFTTRLLASLAVLAPGTLTATVETTAMAGSDERLTVAIGEPGSDSFMFGTELWAMSQIALLPKHGLVLEAIETPAYESRLDLLLGRKVDAALIRGRLPATDHGELRAIMSLWPGGVRAEEAEPAQLLVHEDVKDDVVYLVTKAMFENAGYFKSAQASLGVGELGEALGDLDVPLHDGASRYYLENGVDPRTAVTTTTYRDFDDAALQRGEIEQIAAACRQALELGSLSPLLGDLSSTGCEVYKDRLGGPQAPDATASPAQAAAADKGQDRNAFPSPVGQGGPAIRWSPADGVKAAREGQDDGPVPGTLPTPAIRAPVM